MAWLQLCHATCQLVYSLVTNGTAYMMAGYQLRPAKTGAVATLLPVVSISKHNTLDQVSV